MKSTYARRVVTKLLEDIDWENFWDDAEYYQKEYVEAPLTGDQLAVVENELGYKLNIRGLYSRA